MRTRTREERQKQNRRLIVIGAVIGSLLVLALFPAVRDKVLSIASFAERLKDIHTGALATVAVVALVILAIVDNAEKLHFIWEIGHKLLGFDLESMARHEREFSELPDDYVSRPGLEKELATELAPGDAAKLVVFTGDHDSGKTTTLHYVIPRKLSRAYKGNVILCRGDLQSVESEIGESEEQLRRRLAKRVLRRVLQHAEVPGDIGETAESMSEALTEYFARERKHPWLIVIDQIDSPGFPYADTLPALFGASNTVLVVATHVQLDAHVLDANREEDDDSVTRRDVHVGSFTATEALAMFHKEVHKRGGVAQAGDMAQLRAKLAETSPGIIQRLSDIYVGGGLSAVEQALDAAARGTRRARSIATTIVEQLPAELRAFVAGLSLFAGEQVSQHALAALAASEPCQPAQLDDVLAECQQRRYLEAMPPPRRRGPAAARQHFKVTKLGRSIGELAMHGLAHISELQLGAAVLQYYRSTKMADEASDIAAGVPNILGIMAWAETISRLPDRDIIRLTRQIREALVRSGRWELGLVWLRHSEIAAERLELFRSQGDLGATRAELLLAMGHARTAYHLLDAARGDYRDSSAQAESDRAVGVADEATTQASLDYDGIQQCWLTHLAVAARLALQSPPLAEGVLDTLSRNVDEARTWLRVSRRAAPVNALVATPVGLTLDLDAIQIAQLLGDAQARAGDRAGARHRWHAARSLLRDARAAGAHAQLQPDQWGRIERLEGELSRRFAELASRLWGWSLRLRGRRHLARGLSLATAHGLEGILIVLESADLRLVGVPVRTASGRVRTGTRPRWAMRLTSRWRHLRSARRQLLLANADAGALGALPAQFASLTRLALVTKQLAIMDGGPRYLLEGDAYLQSAHRIAERLRNEMPNLADEVQALQAAHSLPAAQPLPAVLAQRGR
ncbi:MAG TPA: hypothetical protein VGR57_07925 [Ktedonobacterales bacterium]|nr:hypothetical protein [Ktedonobacterales bacterium]